jgi:HEAT repeat protein
MKQNVALVAWFAVSSFAGVLGLGCTEESTPPAEPVVSSPANEAEGIQLPASNPQLDEEARGLLNELQGDVYARMGRIRQLTGEPAAYEHLVPALVHVMQGEDVRRRLAAVDAIGAIGANAGLAAPALAERFDDADPKVRRAALAAAASQEPPAALVLFPRLLHALGSEDPALRGLAAKAIGAIGRHREGPGLEGAAKPTVAPLLALTGDSDEGVRRAAFGALADLGPMARSAVPTLLEALTGADADAAFMATEALGTIGDASPEVVGALLRRLREAPDPYASGVFAALRDLGPPCAPLAVPALAELAAGADAFVAEEAIGTLGFLGERATPALEDLATSEASVLRTAAKSALARIRAAAAK